ncbi:hypothetical protein [Kutzneria sp. NPDC051319]|uniref:hypothetical protein n=1 Tax=Kutzneria sp. NPDC051319 TaxID=3155047 RepID=UPI00341946E7
MCSDRVFFNPPARPHQQVVAVLERALREPTDESRFDASDALVGIALGDDDRDFVEHWCMQIGTRAPSGSPLLGLATLCLDHTARRFGHLSPEAIALATSLAARARTDPSDVSTQALDGYGDIQTYLFPRRYRLPSWLRHRLPVSWWF